MSRCELVCRLRVERVVGIRFGKRGSFAELGDSRVALVFLRKHSIGTHAATSR